MRGIGPPIPKRVKLLGQLADPRAYLPWPYDLTRIQKISENLPANNSDEALIQIVRLARLSLRIRRARAAHNEPTKPNLHAELTRFAKALVEMQRAADGLSAAAHDHLKQNDPYLYDR